jgi:hypothetical protein
LPTSFHVTIPWVMETVRQLQPRSILDVGAGSGRYGFLFREQATYAPQPAGESDSARKNFLLDAIEVHAPYITPLHEQIYDHLFVGPAEQVIDTLGNYDVIFMGDVIEHFERLTGQRLLAQALAHANRAVIVTTPACWMEQGAIFENPAEEHRSFWRPADFDSFPSRRVQTICGVILMAVLLKEGVHLPRRLTPLVMQRGFRITQWMRRLVGRSDPPRGSGSE